MTNRFFLFLLFAWTSFSAEVKLAIIQLDDGGAEQAALLTSALTKIENITVLERDSLEKLVRESALSRSDSGFLKAGQFLGADAILFFQSVQTETNVLLRMRLASVREGAVLYARESAGILENSERWAATTAPQIVSMASKLHADRSQIAPISVLNLRSPSATGASELLDRELTSLLLLRLARETNLLLLERRRLIDLAFEKELADQTEKFWAGAYVLDGTINKAGIDPRKTTVSVRLVAPDKAVTEFEVSAARTNAAGIVNEIVLKTLAAARLQAPPRWSPENEAIELGEEANWALRWRMFPEAQAASESAWALGMHAPSIAVTRCLAYLREVDKPNEFRYPPGYFDKNNGVWAPPMPRVEGVRQALAVMDDFLTRAPSAVASNDVYRAICELLDASGRLLIPHYFVPAIRAGREEKLAEIRALSRRVATVARMNPEIREDLWTSVPRPIDAKFRTPKSLVKLLQDYSGVFEETPEDAVSVYRDIINARSRYPSFRSQFYKDTDKTPSFVGGWKIDDRIRGAAVWDRFIQELIASTNYQNHLDGRILRLVQIQDWPTYLQEHRKLQDQALAHFSKAERKTAGLEDLTYNYFHGNPKPPKEEETTFFYDLIHWSTNLTATPKRAKLETAPIVETAPIEITDFWATSPEVKRSAGHIYREGKVWFLFEGRTFEKPFHQWEIFSFDLASRSKQVIPVLTDGGKRNAGGFTRPSLDELRFTSPPRLIEVLSNEVYLAQGDQLCIYNLRNERWRLEILPEADPHLYVVGNRLFLSGKTTLYERTGPGATQLLASARRRPSATPLDEMNALDYPCVQAGPQGELWVFARSNLFSLANGVWTQQTNLRDVAGSLSDAAGSFLISPAPTAVIQIHSFQGSLDSHRFLGSSLGAGIAMGITDPSLLNGFTNEWTLDNHIAFISAPGFFKDTPVLLAVKDYNPFGKEKPKASIVVFPRNSRRLASIPLVFDGTFSPKFAPKFDFTRPWMIDTPSGIAFGHWRIAGFWFIPRERLEKAFTEALRLATETD